MENEVFLYIKSCRAYLLFIQYLISPHDCLKPKKDKCATAQTSSFINKQGNSTRDAIQEKPGTTKYGLRCDSFFGTVSLTEFPGIPLHFRTDKRKESSKGIPKNTWDQFLTQHLRRSNFP